MPEKAQKGVAFPEAHLQCGGAARRTCWSRGLYIRGGAGNRYTMYEQTPTIGEYAIGRYYLTPYDAMSEDWELIEPDLEPPH